MIDLDVSERVCDGLIEHGLGHLPPAGIGNSVSIKELITRLRQAEKDAARYRWLKANGQLGVGRCGVDWELSFDGPAPDNSAMIERHIDEAMQCHK